MKIFSFPCFLLILIPLLAQGQQVPAWKPVKGHIQTEWAALVNPAAPLPEYPRPQLVRPAWTSLNGLWDYSIAPRSQAAAPGTYEGAILVPFAAESALSGVGRTVGKDSVLWYHRTVVLSPALRRGRVLLHFGAVDWQAEVFVNGRSAGIHEGGYDPFTFDITTLLDKGSKQDIKIRVWDPTDDGPQPRGKQVKRPGSIWYTPVTGIWQTVWLEGVPQLFVESTRQTPDIDAHTITVAARLNKPAPGARLLVSAWNGSAKVAEQEVSAGDSAVLTLPAPRLWSPQHPFLYDLRISVIASGKAGDFVKSYFAMRKISLGLDAAGVERMQLNNQPLFQYGPLDQGWWPDGLYTPPTEAALKFDIDRLKSMGFNMIRKHIKVEPARYYSYCDQAGMLLWQDMPSGDLGNKWENRPGVLDRATNRNRTPESEGYYRKEWNAIMTALYNYPCIVVWTPFNEAWGQFKTAEISEWTKRKDPTRLVNSASGGNFYETGDMVDLHNYPHPAMPRAEIFGRKRAVVLGEFGGLGLPVEGHTWKSSNNWGYQTFKTSAELFARYTTFTNRLRELIQAGLSAAVYTQTSDVEVETNGFMTYDRKVIKMPVDSLRRVNISLYDPALIK